MPKFDSQTELKLIQALSKSGERFRTQVKKLPGSPDIVFFSCKMVIFVHGCYWHRHTACAGRILPKNNWKLWMDKFNLQVLLDQKNYKKLRNRGWWIYIAWECEIQKSAVNVTEDIRRFLEIRRADPHFN